MAVLDSMVLVIVGVLVFYLGSKKNKKSIKVIGAAIAIVSLAIALLLIFS